MGFSSRADKRFAHTVRSSGLVEPADIERALAFQGLAQSRGRNLPLDRILLKFRLLDREQILGLWRALRYYVWRKEDKFYVKIAVQSKLITPEMGKACLREQKQSYKHEDQLVRVNEIARQRGYLKAGEDRKIIEAMSKVRPVTLRPVDDEVAGTAYERPSPGAARKGAGDEWRAKARSDDLAAVRAEHQTSDEALLEISSRGDAASGRRGGKTLSAEELEALRRDHLAISGSDDLRAMSDEDLDALWAEADLDDVELDSQAIEIARGPLDLDDDSDEDSDLLPM